MSSVESRRHYVEVMFHYVEEINNSGSIWGLPVEIRGLSAAIGRLSDRVKRLPVHVTRLTSGVERLRVCVLAGWASHDLASPPPVNRGIP